jgi:thiol-disulfide isomerase/thioredoxin
MGILKIWTVVVLGVALQACTDNETETSKPEASAAAAPVTPAAATPVADVQPAANALPHFMVVDAAGNTLDIQSFKGKKLFVNLWATWCPPCRAEMPSIAKLYEAADKEKAQFILLSLDNDFESAKKYVQEKNLDLPVYYPAGELPELFAVNGIPTTFIFDETGRLTTQREGSENYNTEAYRKLFGAVK